MIRTHRPFWDGHRQARVKTAARCCGATALNTITFVQPKFRVRISPFFFFYPFGENVSFVNANKTTKTILICFKTDWVISFPYLEIWSTSAWQPNIDSRFGLTSGAGGSRKWIFRCRCAEYQNGKSWEKSLRKRELKAVRGAVQPPSFNLSLRACAPCPRKSCRIT